MNEKNILSDILGKYFFSAFRQICNFFIVLCTSSFYEIQSLFFKVWGKKKGRKRSCNEKNGKSQIHRWHDQGEITTTTTLKKKLNLILSFRTGLRSTIFSRIILKGKFANKKNIIGNKVEIFRGFVDRFLQQYLPW